jgi:hypothetical protein
MLNFCASGTKVNHLMRGLGQLPEWKQCDTMIGRALTTICGGVLSDTAHDRATTLPSLGGLGIRNIDPHSTIAHATAVRRAMEQHSKVCAATADYSAPLRVYILARVAADTLLATFTAPVDSLKALLRKDKVTIAARDMQRTCSRALEQLRFDARLAAIPKRETRRRAHLQCATAKYSALWLYGSVTNASRMWLDNGLFVVAIRLRLGEPLATEPLPCVLCKGKFQSDPLGDHTLSCMAAGAKTILHHSIVDEVMALANKAFAMPRREDRPFDGQFKNSRLDVVIRLPGDRAKAKLCDVAVIHPMAAANIKHAGPAAAATAYEKVKHGKYDAAVAALRQADPLGGDSVELCPLVFDTLGGVSSTCVATIKQLALLWGDHAGLSPSTAVTNAFHRINFQLVQAVARLAAANMVAAIAGAA